MASRLRLDVQEGRVHSSIPREVEEMGLPCGWDPASAAGSDVALHLMQRAGWSSCRQYTS